MSLARRLFCRPFAGRGFQGKLSVEGTVLGTVLPNADPEALEDTAAVSIDARLSKRLQSKSSSAWGDGRGVWR